jgi:hypothetical protein
MPRDTCSDPIPRRIAQMLADSFRWLCPSRATAAERAAAGAEAARACDTVLRLALQAGVTSSPDDRIGAAILALQADLRSEAAGLAAWAAMPGCDDDVPSPAMAAE